MAELVGIRRVHGTGGLFGWFNTEDGKIYRERGCYTRLDWSMNLFSNCKPDRKLTRDEMIKMVDAHLYERFGRHLSQEEIEKMVAVLES